MHPGTRPFTHIHFLLLSEFSMLSLCSALEVLRIANRIAGKELFKWTLCSQTGASVNSSLNMALSVDSALPNLGYRDMVFICGGTNISLATTTTVLNWLRMIARRGVTLGGLCTGAFVLARAGLLENRRATIHWENQSSFEECFPNTKLVNTPFEIDGQLYTTAGGTASIDLMLYIIENNQGEDLSDQVAEQLMYSNIRTLQGGAKITTPNRIKLRHSKLKMVIQEMDNNTECPIPISNLANLICVSTRQLERLFRRYMSETPGRYYLELRLMKAHGLLVQTDMSVINVGLACGFSTASNFSKKYRSRFGCSPHELSK